MRRSVLVLLLLVGYTGEPPRQLTQVRDSAGVTIVENDLQGRTGLDTCAVSAAPVLNIGVVEGDMDYEFYRLFDAIRLSDGRIAVVNQGTDEVRFYDGQGRYLASVGREGDGPGEFRNVRRVWELPGDSLLVWDRRQQRFSLFTLSGEFVRSFHVSPFLMNPPDILSALDDGTILTAYRQVVSRTTDFERDSVYHLRFARTGELIDTIGVYATGRVGRLGRPEEAFAGSPLFEPFTQSAASRSGVFVGRGLEREIEVRRADGRLVRLIRWTGGSRDVTDADVNAVRQAALSRLTGDPRMDRLRRLSVEEVPVNDRFPALGDLRLDTEGEIWVEEYPRPGVEGPDRWIVFDSAGNFRCTADTPDGLLIYQIGDDYILGEEQDEARVEYVRMYALARPPKRSG
jgi:hypothetical protein